MVDVQESAKTFSDTHPLFHAIIEHSVDGILVLDQDYLIRYANRSFRISLGGAGAIGGSLLELLPAGQRPTVRQTLAACLQAGGQLQLDLSLVGSNGQSEVFETLVSSYSGQPRQLLLHLRRVSDLRQQQAIERDRELRYQALAEQASDAFFVHDFNGRLVEVNQRACDSLGYTRAELLRMSVTDIECDFDLAAAQGEWSRIEPGVDFTLYGHQRRKNGTIFPVEIRFGCTTWRGERLYLGLVRDITERQQAAEKFRAIVEGAPDPIFIQTDDRFAYLNPAACQLFGVATPATLIGSPVIERIHPSNRERVQQRIHQLNVDREPVNELFEQCFLRMDGSAVWVETKGEPIDYEGRPGALVFVRDVSTRREAAEQLRQSDQLLQMSFDHSALGMCLATLDGTLVRVNRQLGEMFLLSQEAMTGKRFADLVHPDEASQDLASVQRMIEGELRTVTLERRFVRSNGQAFDGIITAALLRDQDGRPTHYITQIQDTTERKAMEAELRRREAFSRTVMDNLPIGIAVNSVFPTVEFTYMNDNFVKFYRTSREQLTGPDAFWTAVYEEPEFRQEIQQQVLSGIASGDSAQMRWLDVPITRRGEETRYVSAFNTPVPGENLAISTVLDVTERKLAAEALRQNAARLQALHDELEQRVRDRTRLLEAANRELEAFSYSVSHDLRAPLRAVDGYVQILLEDYGEQLDDEGKRICSVISRSAMQMGELIDDLLALSRVGRATLQPAAVNMTALARSIYHELTTERERQRIDLQLAELPDASADPTLTRQIWANLLSNATKFSGKKPRATISITACEQGEEVIYSISDNGAGFDMQYRDKLFGVFQRLHSSQEFEGTGVGLAIVQRIVQRHGGRVWAEGVPGQGATFYFTLRKVG